MENIRGTTVYLLVNEDRDGHTFINDVYSSEEEAKNLRDYLNDYEGYLGMNYYIRVMVIK